MGFAAAVWWRFLLRLSATRDRLDSSSASLDSVRLAVSDPADLPAPGSDAALLSEGYATLTALRSIAEDPSVLVEDMLHPE